jgi:exopolyphosphatase/guanosine-5'-triphosphate,3'-diphosphate pyrophosphatase
MASPTLLIDIGGGSVEFIVVARGENVFARSLKLGAARMSERFVTTDPLSGEEIGAMRAHFEDTLGPVFDACRAHDVTNIVGSSGTMKSLARVALSKIEANAGSVFQRTFSVGEMRKALQWVIESTAEQRVSHPAIDPKRVDQIGAGAVLLDTVCDHLPEVGHLKVSPNALREGMVVHFMDTNYTRLRQIAPFQDPRRRSVHEMAYRFQWEERHAQHVAATSTFLFHVCQSLYAGPSSDSELLEYAGLLHDVGYLLSHATHEKHSRYLIRNADLQGFSQEEIILMSLVARYHRGTYPAPSHKHYRTLSSGQQKRVRQMASLVRIAEGLDRSHFQNVVALRARLTDDALNLSVATKGDPQLEVWSGMDRGEMFENEYGRALTVESTSIDAQVNGEAEPVVTHVTPSSV